MDIIYSRHNINRKKWRKKSFFIVFIAIMIIAYLTAISIINSINPSLERQEKIIAKSKAQKLTSEATANAMKDLSYDDLCDVQKDDSGNITMIKMNVITVNNVCSKIALEVQKNLNENSNDDIAISLGSVTGNKLLAGKGPKINVKIKTMGNVETSTKSEIKETGINQSLHKIYLNLNCHVSIISPYKDAEEEINSEVLLSESVIVGKIPETYYNLNGITADDTMNMMN